MVTLMPTLDELPRDICPVDVIALRDGACPFCGWEPEIVPPERAWDPRDDVPGIHGW